MATSKLALAFCVFASAAAWPREAASPVACQAAASQPAIAAAKAASERSPNDLKASFALADAWSDAGCFNDAVQILQSKADSNPGNKELETRLRVARSLVGEEHFFDSLDRANLEAQFKRDSFRCGSLADLQACGEAVHLKPADAGSQVALGDALMRAKRPADAVEHYRLAAAAAPNGTDVAAKIAAAEAQSAPTPGPTPPPVRPPPTIAVAQANFGSPTPRRYSNAAPESQSH